MARRLRSLNSGAFRFALAFSAVFAVAAVLLLGMVRHQVGRYAYRATTDAMASEAASLAAEAPAALPAEIRRRMDATPDGTFQYLLVDRTGRPMLGTIPPAAAHVGQGAVVMREHAPTPSDPERPERLATLGTRLSDGSLLVVATDAYDVAKLGGHMIRFTIIWAVAITLLALVGGWVAGVFFLKRLSLANAAVDRIMGGRMEERLPMFGLAPELDDLARNLNRMLDRIAGLMDGLRQVSTDVAHDLRTPLTRLRQKLEVSRDAASRAEVDAGIDASIDQVDRLLDIFRAILRLAQIEGGGRRARFETVDLSGVLAGLIETYEPVAADAGHRLDARLGLRADVEGDPELLAQLFANLIENAIIHTPAGTKVSVDVHASFDAITVRVADDGPGVPAAEHAKITRRFYQLDPSRGRGGAGLGLAIADAIATLHEAVVEIADAGPGLIVGVRFPAASKADLW